MARVVTNGFEVNSVTNNPSGWETISGSPSLSSSTVRSGVYAGRISGLSSGAAMGWVKKWLGSTADGPYFGRVYLRVATRPSASNHIISFNSASGTAGTSDRIKITLESDGTLILRLADGTAIGSPSAALALDTWYMVELKFDRTPAGGSEIAEARLNGTIFATSNTLTLPGSAFAFSVGGNLDLEAQTTGEWFFDDLAVNDTTGSFQTTYPGESKIIALFPNAAGDVNTFATQTGGTAGASNNYTRVDENPPNDTTDLNGSNTLNQEDLFNLVNSGLAAGDTINVVEVWARFRNNTADAVTAAKLEIEKAAAGTILQSAAFIPNTTGFNTNGTASPRNPLIVTYQDPDGAAWTSTTLDSMQIGYKITTGGTNRIEFTEIFAVVDYTPSSGITTTQDIQGRARIEKSVTQTILGKADILKSVARTIAGLARIQKSVTQTIQGLARITASTSRTITGISRITATTLRTIAGKAAILKTTLQTITGIARIQKSVAQTITGLARITASTAQTIQGRARITVSTSRTIQGLARITITTAQTIAGISRITATTARTITGKAAIFRTTSQTIDGLARIALVTTQNILGRSRITAATLRIIQGLARIEKSVTQTISGRARITAQAVQTIVGKARIQISTSRTIQGISRIALITTRTIAGKARITATVAQTIPGVATITNGTQQIITGMARITVSVTRTILGRARISVSTTRNIQGKAMISDTVTTRNITGKADIKATTARTISGKSAIARTTSQTITGMALIVPRPPRRIFNVT